jgi:hypothetical protein
MAVKRHQQIQQQQQPPQSPTREQIAEYAYKLYEERGRVPGREMEDWLKAEESLAAASTQQGSRRQTNLRTQPSKQRMSTVMIEEGTNPWEHAAHAATHTTNRLK